MGLTNSRRCRRTEISTVHPTYTVDIDEREEKNDEVCS